jgi:hypothetical protein
MAENISCGNNIWQNGSKANDGVRNGGGIIRQCEDSNEENIKAIFHNSLANKRKLIQLAS